MNAEKLVAKDGANAERLVAENTANEKLEVEVDIQVVSSLTEWDDVVANGFTAGCIWSTGQDDESIAAVWTDNQGKPVEEHLLPQYRRFARAFSREEQERLPEHGPWDMEIDLEPGKQPSSGHLYPLSYNELEAMREYINEMLRAGKIRPSKSPADAPIFFVPKLHGRRL